MADYRIESDGTVVVYLSEKATKWVTEPKPAVGARLAFKTKSDTAERRAIYESGYPSVGKFPIKNGKKIRLRPDDL